MAKFLLVCTLIALVQWWSSLPSTLAFSLAIDKDRNQLLNDAVGWMTFRKNGQLMKQDEVAPLFVHPLQEQYVRSKLYRTFVIAFQKGVLPKLTLQENQACDPAYTKEYKDPGNNSVTWHYQKKFTFDLYAKRRSSSLQLCDYRQGLVCHPQTKTCQCPEGASMSPIDQGSLVKRCLLKQDEICALIDTDHGNDPQHSTLVANIYHLAFNLEKPPSCQPGTQCRFKDNAYDYPRCYSSGPFSSQNFVHILGDECAIGLYATPGNCELNGGVGDLQVLVCYNFGPSRNSPPGTIDSGRKGFCSSYFGSIGITNVISTLTQYYHYPLFIPFVHPRTVPLRNQELKTYYQTFVEKVMPWMDLGRYAVPGLMARKEGEKCSVAKTEQFEKAWQYFADLEGPPAPGSEYVATATKAELNANLQTLVDFSYPEVKLKTKVCKVGVVPASGGEDW